MECKLDLACSLHTDELSAQFDPLPWLNLAETSWDILGFFYDNSENYPKGYIC